MKTLKISRSVKAFFIVIAVLFFSIQAEAQVKEEKQSPLKGLGSKIKEKAIPEVLGGKKQDEKESNSKGKNSEKKEGQSEEEVEDPEEEIFDEDEEDIDKMADKMIRQLGHNPDNVKRMMEEGPESNPRMIPEPDEKVLASIKATPKNGAELLNYIKNFENGAERALSPQAKKEVPPHLNKGLQTKEAAYMMWLAGKQEPAAYLLLKASISDPQDEVLLSNLSSVITMAGYAEKSIPILEYLYAKYPQSSIINNNLGQAWLSLGQVTKAKPYLEKAVTAYEQHPEANRSLARIALKEGNHTMAKVYLKNALKGGFSQEAYYELKDLDPGQTQERIESIKINHQGKHKEIAITKRFTMPKVPENVQVALSREQDIADFFHGLQLTLEALRAKYPSATDNILTGYSNISNQMAINTKKMNSLEDVQKQYQLAAQIWHPFKIQAQEVLMAEIDDSYASSFTKRIEKLQKSRDAQIDAMEKSFGPEIQKINETSNRIAVLEDGNGSGSEINALIKQLCEMRKRLEKSRMEKSAAINNAFVHEMESLAFQQLQELTYWYTLYFLPQDPVEFNNALYGDYLNTLAKLQKYYPYPVVNYDEIGCDLIPKESPKANGKMSVWEDSHCITYWDLDFHFVKSKFTCKEATVGGKLYDIEFGGGQKYDPSTLETVEHSLYVGGKVGERGVTMGKSLESKIGAELVTTVKLDGNFQLKDIIVKASIGTELGLHVPKSTDPNDSGLDIRQAASIGVSKEYEISILSGFRGDVPKVTTVGNIFNQ